MGWACPSLSLQRRHLLAAAGPARRSPTQIPTPKPSWMLPAGSTVAWRPPGMSLSDRDTAAICLPSRELTDTAQKATKTEAASQHLPSNAPSSPTPIPLSQQADRKQLLLAPCAAQTSPSWTILHDGCHSERSDFLFPLPETLDGSPVLSGTGLSLARVTLSKVALACFFL